MTLATVFEDTGAFSSLAQEATWLASLEASSSRVAVSTIGTSQGGETLRAIYLGAPTPHPTPLDPLLVVGLQHGNEPAGREAAFKLARDLAETTDTDLVAYLEAHTVCILPTTNPDGYPDTREVNNGINLNRDHLNIDTPEGKAIADVLRDLQPHVIIDLHENGDTSNSDMEVLESTNPAVDAGLKGIGQSIRTDIGDAITASGEGWSFDVFSGGTSETILRNAAGLRHAVGVLTETLWTSIAADRVAQQYAALDVALNYHRTNAASVASAVGTSRSSNVTAGKALDPYNGGGALNLNPGPAGYMLTAAQLATVSRHRGSFGVRYREALDGGFYVTMAQAARPVIPYLMDSRSDNDEVAATVLAEPPALTASQVAVLRDLAPTPVDIGVIRDGQFVLA